MSTSNILFSLSDLPNLFFSKQGCTSEKLIFILDRKETLNEILLRRATNKPCISAIGQNTCPVRGLVKGKFLGLNF